jgi:hypothetical protein
MSVHIYPVLFPKWILVFPIDRADPAWQFRDGAENLLGSLSALCAATRPAFATCMRFSFEMVVTQSA